MGYTHYWKMEEPLKVSQIQRDLIKEVLLENKSLLAGGDGHGPVIFGATVLSFNGRGEDDSHETFEIQFGTKKDFDFCKTARKPYDLAVCKILCVLSLSKGFNFSSDGTEQNEADETYLGDENWPEALKWFADKGYQSTIDKKINPYLNKRGD